MVEAVRHFGRLTRAFAVIDIGHGTTRDQPHHQLDAEFEIKPDESEVPKGYYLEHRPATFKRCQEYCSVNKFCPHFNNVTF